MAPAALPPVHVLPTGRLIVRFGERVRHPSSTHLREKLPGRGHGAMALSIVFTCRVAGTRLPVARDQSSLPEKNSDMIVFWPSKFALKRITISATERIASAWVRNRANTREIVDGRRVGNTVGWKFFK